MSRKLFGTDGIRAAANTEPMTAATMLRLAMAAGRYFRRGDHRHRVVIGKDTRLSGYMIEPALTSGFVAMGMDVVLVGPMPTPAVAMLTRSLRADLGVVISASHNPYQDNGIKLFGPDGFKLSDSVEIEIERLMDNGVDEDAAVAKDLGRARRLDDAPGRYIEFVKNTFPRELRLDGLKIVIDCANGAAYRVAPTVLWELGADVIPMAVSPDGLNINDRCGATDTTHLREQVITHGADLGIALDGDADRLALVDEHGAPINGDQMMALIARYWQQMERIRGGGLVATVMSNLGLERFLQGLGLRLERTQVGDRYVVEHMRAGGYNIGGEQSGHLILSDYATTGDGLIAALQVLAVLVKGENPVSDVAHVFDPLPQFLRSVPDAGRDSLADSRVKDRIAAATAQLGDRGRLVVRQSGTEPIIRVMAEGEDAEIVTGVIDDIANAIAEAAISTR
ncbi:MAG: phosphoglucosamine mutase [Alphaproteobacteria bacterium]|nr:phosphoglucosamine mutase [Alphaproteobacteria bacterium]